MNRRIRVPQVRVIGADGAQLGVLDTSEALRIAEEGGLDLVEVSPKAMPPVCKIMDYGKFKYEEKKKASEAKKKQVVVHLKEVKLRPKTEDHDYDFKVRNVKRFLEEGNKARITIMFRGREITHPEIGRELLQRVATNLGAAANVEKQPSMEGRFMNMILAPVAPKPAPKPKQPRAERPPREGTPAEPPQDGAMAAALRKSGVADSEPPAS